MDKRTTRRLNDDRYRLDGNLKQKYLYRKKSAEKMAKELSANGIKPVIVKDDPNKTYDVIKKQWNELKSEIRKENYLGYLVNQNKINRERYQLDKQYREHKKKSATKQHISHIEYVRNLEIENRKLREKLK